MATAPLGWMSSAGGVSYPPAPWHLRGRAYVSAWRVPAGELPATCLPPDARPVAVFGRAVVGTAWAAYKPGGVLAYNEVLVAMRVRVGGRPFTTITHIWVDHPASIAGGRELWGIPKQQAIFQVHDGRGAGGGFAASAATRTGNGSPRSASRAGRRCLAAGVSAPGRRNCRRTRAEART